jgi:dihydropyrimidinase
LQYMLPMYFSEGVHRRRIPLQRFVENTSTNAARIFGLYPRKGAIRENSDGDIVIWDQGRTAIATADADLSNADYSVYEGWNVTGWRSQLFDEERLFTKAAGSRVVPALGD